MSRSVIGAVKSLAFRSNDMKSLDGVVRSIIIPSDVNGGEPTLEANGYQLVSYIPSRLGPAAPFEECQTVSTRRRNPLSPELGRSSIRDQMGT